MIKILLKNLFILHPSAFILYFNHIIHITFKRIIVRNDKKLVERLFFGDLTDLFGEAFAPRDVHIRRRFVEKRQTDIGKLL